LPPYSPVRPAKTVHFLHKNSQDKANEEPQRKKLAPLTHRRTLEHPRQDWAKHAIQTHTTCSFDGHRYLGNQCAQRKDHRSQPLPKEEQLALPSDQKGQVAIQPIHKEIQKVNDNYYKMIATKEEKTVAESLLWGARRLQTPHESIYDRGLSDLTLQHSVLPLHHAYTNLNENTIVTYTWARAK
jgi:hypothetical protein